MTVEPAQKIDEFLTIVSRYLSARHCHQLYVSTPQRLAVGSPAEREWLSAVQRLHDTEYDARDEVLRSGEALAAVLEDIQEDSKQVLKLLHFVGGGGGPDNAYRIWPDLKARLRQISIRRQRRNRPSPEAKDRCAVELFGKDQPPVVFGKKKPILTDRRYDIVKALTDAWPAPLTEGQLRHRTDYSQPSKALRAIADSDPDWWRAVQRPKARGDGFRLAP